VRFARAISHLQVPKLCEGFAAAVELAVNLVVRVVRLHVCPDVATLCERLCAQVTLVRFIACVTSHMRLRYVRRGHDWNGRPNRTGQGRTYP
jgi:hypothetical protein